MPPSVVDALEVIDVRDEERQRLAVQLRALQGLGQVRFKEAAVVDAGQRVRHGQFQRLAQGTPEPIVEALALDLRAHAGEQFVPVDGSQDVVVGAELQRLCDPHLVARLAGAEDRRLPRRLVGSDLGAEAEWIERLIGQSDDEEVVSSLPGRGEEAVEVALGLDGMLDAQAATHLLGLRLVVQHDDVPAGAGLAKLAEDVVAHHDAARRFRPPAKLVGQLLQPRQAAHAREKLQVAHRLGQEIVGSGLQALHAIAPKIKRRDENDRQMTRQRIALQGAADVVAAHPGHHDIQEDKVDRFRTADRDGVRAASCQHHVEIFGGEPRLHQLQVHVDIVDDQDAGGHGGSRVAEKGLDRLDELRDRDRFCDIGLAPAVPDPLLIALHRKGCHGDHGNRVEFLVLLQLAGDLQAGPLGKLDVHEDQVGPVLARQVKGGLTCAGLNRAIAVRLDQVAEELHVELVVLHDHDGLRHFPYSSRE